MPTVDIRPEAIGSDSGFDQTGTNLLQRINDNNTSTFITNISSASFDVLIENSSAYSGATINNVTVAVIGNTINDKVSSASLVVELRDASSLLQSSTLNFTPTESTQTGAAYSTNLTPSVVDSFTLNGAVQTVGLIIKEVFIRVDYSAPVGGKIILSSGKIHLAKGKITL
jgi:hypothetical protein|tara:strand:- start:554 stop:1063 length:510 start_codon:yes stop_codon:yes gene_type:complete